MKTLITENECQDIETEVAAESPFLPFTFQSIFALKH